MDEIILVKEPITLEALKNIANKNDSDLVKAVVDIKLQIFAIGGYMHADEEKELLDLGSHQDNLWGINLYPDLENEDFIEFDSMINVRPRLNNFTRGIDSTELQKKIVSIVTKLVK